MKINVKLLRDTTTTKSSSGKRSAPDCASTSVRPKSIIRLTSDAHVS